MAFRVAYSGKPGAYAELAVHRHFNGTATAVETGSFEDIFKSVEQNDADFGVVPIENVLVGDIGETNDLLWKYPLMIRGDIWLPIAHRLIANPGATLASIRRVYSHDNALKQCRKYLEEHHFEPILSPDTASAVVRVKTLNRIDEAAIGSEAAAKKYCMEILADDLAPHYNATRFLIVGRESDGPGEGNKVSLAFQCKNEPSGLRLCLETLCDVNIARIQRRPVPRAPGDYCFFIDVDCTFKDERIQRAIPKLAESALAMKYLGCYTADQRPT
jgi:chorismate mutase/prephenate dehydratase